MTFSTLFSGLLSDSEAAEIFGDAATVGAMIKVEKALARVQARAGLIPAATAETIVAAAESLHPDLEELIAGSARSGVPVIALVEQLRAAAGPDAGAYVHWGATSQDVMDTALVLRLGRLLEILEDRLVRVAERLAALAERHRSTLMAARTRSQQALPTTFGLKAANWLLPLLRHRQRLAEIKPRLLVVQLGGAAGTLAALNGQGLALMAALAEDLGLGLPPAPWHSQRDNLVELAGWLALVTSSLGKLGRDLVLLGQSEVAEVRPGTPGASSTLPHKSNPVAAETLVTLAAYAAGRVASAHQAMVHEHERDGAAWQLESLVLPELAVATAAALGHAEAVLADLVVDDARMRQNLEATGGLVLAEAASFALAAHMPRSDAQALVQEACREAASGGHLIEILRERTSAPVDWPLLADPAKALGATDALIDRILAKMGEQRS